MAVGPVGPEGMEGSPPFRRVSCSKLGKGEASQACWPSGLRLLQAPSTPQQGGRHGACQGTCRGWHHGKGAARQALQCQGRGHGKQAPGWCILSVARVRLRATCPSLVTGFLGTRGQHQAWDYRAGWAGCQSLPPSGSAYALWVGTTQSPFGHQISAHSKLAFLSPRCFWVGPCRSRCQL